jgi:hypothetical protein
MPNPSQTTIEAVQFPSLFPLPPSVSLPLSLSPHSVAMAMPMPDFNAIQMQDFQDNCAFRAGMATVGGKSETQTVEKRRDRERDCVEDGETVCIEKRREERERETV